MVATRKDPPGDESASASKKSRMSSRLNPPTSGDTELSGDTHNLEDSVPSPQGETASARAIDGVSSTVAGTDFAESVGKSAALSATSASRDDVNDVELDSKSAPTKSIATPPSTPEKKRTERVLESPFSLRSDSGSPSASNARARVVRSATELKVTGHRLLPYGARNFLDDDVVDRINRAIQCRHREPITYAVSTFPKTFAWGPPSVDDSQDLSSYVTEGTQMVRVLVVGEVVSAFLRGTEVNKGVAAIRIKPLLMSDGLRLDNLVEGFATSSLARAGEANTKGIYMNRRVGETCAFLELFDARKGFLDKPDVASGTMPDSQSDDVMGLLTPADFHTNDIVYAEAYIQRYMTKSEGPMKYLSGSKSIDWAKIPYRVGLQLVALSLVANAPVVVRERGVAPKGM